MSETSIGTSLEATSTAAVEMITTTPEQTSIGVISTVLSETSSEPAATTDGKTSVEPILTTIEEATTELNAAVTSQVIDGTSIEITQPLANIPNVEAISTAVVEPSIEPSTSSVPEMLMEIASTKADISAKSDTTSQAIDGAAVESTPALANILNVEAISTAVVKPSIEPSTSSVPEMLMEIASTKADISAKSDTTSQAIDGAAVESTPALANILNAEAISTAIVDPSIELSTSSVPETLMEIPSTKADIATKSDTTSTSRVAQDNEASTEFNVAAVSGASSTEYMTVLKETTIELTVDKANSTTMIQMTSTVIPQAKEASTESNLPTVSGALSTADVTVIKETTLSVSMIRGNATTVQTDLTTIDGINTTMMAATTPIPASTKVTTASMSNRTVSSIVSTAKAAKASTMQPITTPLVLPSTSTPPINQSKNRSPTKLHSSVSLPDF